MTIMQEFHESEIMEQIYHIFKEYNDSENHDTDRM